MPSCSMIRSHDEPPRSQEWQCQSCLFRSTDIDGVLSLCQGQETMPLVPCTGMS